ncbi:hypothetical protein LIER_14876 [Lithospermum erythrorhizon]|uniref:Uncharacterized protein n=1 Tax=Lithospermum erythrorhizon TaxID=34254 RepID=A0AAV3Q2A9_LITER
MVPFVKTNEVFTVLAGCPLDILETSYGGVEGIAGATDAFLPLNLQVVGASRLRIFKFGGIFGDSGVPSSSELSPVFPPFLALDFLLFPPPIYY